MEVVEENICPSLFDVPEPKVELFSAILCMLAGFTDRLRIGSSSIDFLCYSRKQRIPPFKSVVGVLRI